MHLWIGMNFITLALMLGSAELLARLLSTKVTSTPTSPHQYEMLLGRILYPQSWSQVAASFNKVIDRMSEEGSFLIDDRFLGWRLKPSYDGKESSLFFGSAEGLRSPRAGMTFVDPRIRHSGILGPPASVRVALIGDSFTYGDEVRCEESWGHVLEALLQPNTQVLNFGVNAYGLNQVLLRYERDVRPWKPKIVVVSIFSDMIKRVVNIYPFVRDPKWSLPFARPRLVMKNDIPSTINHPLPKPRHIFSLDDVSELPFLEHDEYYHPFEWEQGGIWYPFEKSYVFRLAYSFRPPVDGEENERAEKALRLGESLLQYLIRKIREDGAVPFVVYVPSKGEFLKSAKPANRFVPLAIRMLRNAEIEYFDPTICLSRLDATNAYMEGGHYSPLANSEIAHCLESTVRGLVARADG